MVEMKDIQVMTDRATPKSLVIIDELGRGTSTKEGMAIAQAVIEYMHDEIGCKTLVSTHYHELAGLEEKLPRLENCSMAVKESGEQVTFLRKLVRGAADTSYGIYCARIAGVRRSIIDRAYTLLRQYENGSDAAREEKLPLSDPAAFSESTAASESAAATEETAGAVQLSLFPDPVESKRRREPEKQVLNAVRRADLMNMTPLEAMQLINEWKQKLMES